MPQLARSGPGLDESRNTTSLTIFTYLWAAAALYHQIQQYQSFERVLYFPLLHQYLSISCVLLLCWPTSRVLFINFFIAEFILIWQESPNISNHWFLQFIVAATVIAILAATMFRERTIKFDRSRLYKSLAPLLRLECIILYFFVVLHKLNWDYFDLDLSCAPHHYQVWKHEYLSFLPTPEWLLRGTIPASLLIETMIPVLLLSRRYRALGALIGIVFHIGLGFSGHLAFSATMYALYVPFLEYDPSAPRTPGAARAGDWLHRATEFLRRFAPVRGVEASFRVARPTVLATSLCLFLIVALAKHRSEYFAFPLYVAFVSAGFAYWHGQSTPNGERLATFLRPGRAWHWIFPLVLIAGGMSPYLGLRTDVSFAMFSNLRTEGGMSNHILIPEWLRIADYQDRLVKIDKSVIGLKRLGVRAGQIVPYYTLRDAVSKLKRSGRKDIEVAWTDLTSHARLSETNAELHPELSEPHPYLFTKYFRFRRIAIPNRCLH